MTDATAGFDSVTPLPGALETLAGACTPIDRTEQLALVDAADRVLAEPIVAQRSIPAYERVAMDGYAVEPADTFEASGRSPAVLTIGSSVGNGTAVPVNTGDELPDGAGAVVKIEGTERHGDRVEIFERVAGRDNVAPVGEDVADDQKLFEPGHQLRPSDLALCKAAGLSRVTVYEQPAVSVIPTGEELVQDSPDPGQTIETNGQMVTQYVEQWGGVAAYNETVPDDHEALTNTVRDALDHDMIVTTGGSSVGARDLLPSVVEELGTLHVHGVAISPGHPVGLGMIEETPIVVAPGYPVACLIAAVQCVRPLLKQVGHLPVAPLPTTEARLTRKLPSEPGVQTFARVTLDQTTDPPTATPTRTRGAGVLSSVALADGWVVIDRASEGIPRDAMVTVENWEAHR
ncbi:molybdopterin molybdotransferase MoeA [Halocatena halophila]|uniref:molybdopterin molybdotransferase MoeA n=1 Tax=Halocatena halophila TaxID=2814576 RepID=UPI002ED3F212